ncbi:MAG: hypothetical protein ABEJ76_08945 [Halanaeroarchaeum sp.]
MFVPLQVPGGVELIVILLVVLLLLAVPLGLVAVVVWALRRRRGQVEGIDSRVEALDERIEDVESRLEE